MPRRITLKDLETQVEAVQTRIEALEAKREALLADAATIDDEIASLRGTRGPGRPRGRGGRAGRRPGRPPGRPSGRTGVRKPRRTGPRKTGLTDFIRAKVAKKALSVARLATLAGKAGYESRNMPQVIRLMVGKSPDLLRRPDDTIAAKGRVGRPAGAAKKGRAGRRGGRKPGRPAKARAPAKTAEAPAPGATPVSAGTDWQA